MAESDGISAYREAIYGDGDASSVNDVAGHGPPSGPVSNGWRWGSAAVAAALGFVPGTAHLFVGRPARAFLWSAAFLGLCVPIALVLYLCWAYTPTVRLWIGGVCGLFYLISVRGPVLESLLPNRSDRIRAEGRDRYAALSVIGAFGVFVLSSACLEIVVFRRACVRDHVVESARLVPLLGEGEDVSVLMSTYVRPVHGEIVLFHKRSGAGLEGESSARSPEELRLVLGRVIACPRDSVACEDRALLVNGIGVDALGFMDRKILEKAGRRERRHQLLKTLTSLLMRDAESPEPVLVWGADDWGAVSVPPHEFLVVPDTRHSPEGVSGMFGWLVHDDDIVGRIVY